jgi:predicted metal-dependent peptidase
MFTQEQMEKICAKIVGDYPLFSRWVFSTEVEPNEFIPTLQITTGKMEYNPVHMERTSPIDRYFKVLHEYAHVFLDHPARIHKLPDQKKRQEAADYEVNDLLLDCGLELPWDAVWSPRFKGMPLEEIYQLLEDEPRSNDKDWNPKKHGKCGSDQEKKEHDAKAKGEEAPPPPTEQEMKKAAAEHRQKQIEAIQQGRMMGSMPAGLKRRLDKITESKTDWKQALPDVIEDLLGADDYTFQYPDRRYDCDFILPGMVGKRPGVFGLFMDTSCSIGKDELAKMAGEAMEIIQQNRPEVTYVLWCDTRVKGPQTVHNTDPWEPKPVGGGGTDFRPPFKWIEQENIEPTMAFYMTDGFCNRFAPEPDYPVVWVIWGQNERFNPPYGTVIRM